MRNLVLWLLLATIWSSSYAAIKIGIETISPMSLVSGRMLIGAVLLLGILLLRGGKLHWQPKVCTSYFISALMGSVIPFCLISYGEQSVDSGLAAILMGIAPVATVLFAPLILNDEKLTPYSMGGILVGIVGLIIIVGIDALAGIGNDIQGQGAIIGAALCYAFTTIYVRRYAKQPPLEMAAGSCLVGAAFITILTVLLNSPESLNIPSTGSIMAVCYLGIFPTAMATLIYFYLVPQLGASRMSQINFLVPVGGALIGVVAFGEILKATTVLGMVVTMLSVYLVTSKQKPVNKRLVNN